MQTTGAIQPSEGDKGEDEDADDVHGLPEGVADGQADAAQHVLAEGSVESHLVFLAVQERVGLFAQVAEQRRANDEHEVFEEGEAEEDKHQMDHQAAHDEEEAEDGASLVLEEAIDTVAAEPRY